MFTQSARYYDLIYSKKDYETEVEILLQIIHQRLSTGSRKLLDVACGTGRHIESLKEHFEVEGLDLNAELLEIAAQRNPDVPFHCGDMISFELNKKFDIVTCLFSSIGYVKTKENLCQAIRCMGKHVAPGGLLIIEPWFTPDSWTANTVHALFIDEPDLKIARINTSLVEGRLSIFDFHYLVGTPQETIHFVESHALGLFETSEIVDAFRSAGFIVFFDPKGLTGRGLFTGHLPAL